jgi:hypothetical protein
LEHQQHLLGFGQLDSLLRARGLAAARAAFGLGGCESRFELRDATLQLCLRAGVTTAAFADVFELHLKHSLVRERVFQRELLLRHHHAELSEALRYGFVVAAQRLDGLVRRRHGAL